MPSQTREAKFWIIFLFGGSFLVGMALAKTLVSEVMIYRRVGRWDRVDAELTAASFIHESHEAIRLGKPGPGPGGTYRYEVRYTFSYKGRQWRGERAGLMDAIILPFEEVLESGTVAEDVMSYKREERRYVFPDGNPHVLAWVNPDDPNESVLYREPSLSAYLGPLAFIVFFFMLGPIVFAVVVLIRWLNRLMFPKEPEYINE
jgi:hypothetical protein